ncbi:putative r3h domain protein [Diaporthe ampelina]|uniref:Putative r3h domain protein n=1 Tax=Diaporthe ampelina TaxID=1214573 RepID=A0A0G2HJF5_9PEZI|nr:putative r3h domain protein [Diaporthe ampelina]
MKTGSDDTFDQDKLVDGLDNLKIEPSAPSLVVNDINCGSTGPSSKAQSPSDETSQKADSSSELGTKPPSLDGKSITSGTTFNALDEKESLRPDDSASVMAAEQDDDVFSIRGSLIAGSRMGSEVAARVYRIQLGDMPPRSIAPQHVIVESGNRAVTAPQSVSMEQQPVTDAKIALVGATSAPNGMYGQNPDEKLLEAMQSQKDRFFLLKLEEMVIEFVQDSKEPFMDLPPSNSFCRMLTHKLADYYHMTHSFEAGAGAVRIFRTPFCRVPPSLASIAQSASAASTPPPIVMPKKIMRRGEEGEFGPGSAGPSKPSSETGSDSKDKQAAKEKMSREEREEAYNKARERIFGTASTEISTPENDDSTGVSRASSVSMRDRINGAKKAKKRRDSDTFDTRSNYVAYAPAYGHPHQATWAQPHYMPAGAQLNGSVQQSFPPAVPNMYGVPNQQFPPMVPGNGYGPPYNNMSNVSHSGLLMPSRQAHHVTSLR